MHKFILLNPSVVKEMSLFMLME
jgi:hypothetical protein